MRNGYEIKKIIRTKGVKVMLAFRLTWPGGMYYIPLSKTTALELIRDNSVAHQNGLPETNLIDNTLYIRAR